MKRKHMVLATFVPSSYSGWGVLCLNLMLQWGQHADLALLSTCPLELNMIKLDPLGERAIAPLIRGSMDIQDMLTKRAGERVDMPCPLLAGLGNQLVHTGSGIPDVTLSGRPNVGMLFLERTDLSAEALHRATEYELLLVGSTWNRDILKARGVEGVEVAIQGVDPTLFHPAPSSGLWRDRFVVFSGGKLEVRKGQDLVIRAFRRFAESHPEAVLVTAWSSFWPALARRFDQQPGIEPVPFAEDGSFDTAEWTRRNGIPDDRVIHLGMVPNEAMARLMREADVALFPNRAEGGTNVVAMECLACGVPTILSANTGHLDIIREDTCFPLERQSPVAARDADGWGESDVDEIVETLERIHADRPAARRRGLRGAEFMTGLSWRHYAEAVAGHLRPWLTDEAYVA